MRWGHARKPEHLPEEPEGQVWEQPKAEYRYDPASRRTVRVYTCQVCHDEGVVSVPVRKEGDLSPLDIYLLSIDPNWPKVARVCPECRKQDSLWVFNAGRKGVRRRLDEQEVAWVDAWLMGYYDNKAAIAEEIAAFPGGRQAWRDAQFAKIQAWMAQMDAKSEQVKKQVPRAGAEV